MGEQKGRVFHKGPSWFVQYRDNILQPDGTVRRVRVCHKLDVAYGGEYKTERSVRPFVKDFLAPINSGVLNPQSTMTVAKFVDTVYLIEFVEKQLRPATRKQYKDVWKNHLKARVGSLTLRGFRTVHGESILANIAEQAKLGRSSLRHCKAFLSGAFKQAKRLGVLDGLNPMQDTSLPRVAESEQDTYAYSLPEISTMLSVLAEPERTVVLLAAFTGLRKSEIRGLRWSDFDGVQLAVNRSRWNRTESEPKTRRSKAPIPVVRQLVEALEKHRLRSGKLAQKNAPIFQNGTGTPLHLDNLVRRVVVPALTRCAICHKSESEHKPEAHAFDLDKSMPRWQGWHAFRRGLATNLHSLGVGDKTIQAILRHSTLALTMNVYVKTVGESQSDALASLSEKLGRETGMIQ
jgi:integrase